GRLEREAVATARAWAEWQAAAQALQAAQAGSRDAEIRAERLRWELDEIEQLRLVEGEWERLSAEQSRLAHARALLEGADAIANALSRGDGALTETLGSLQQRLGAHRSEERRVGKEWRAR